MRLNMATRGWHAEVDEPWLDLLRPNVGRADYLAQLVRVYGFVAPFESACKYTPNVERSVDLRHRARAGLIAQDLLALGLSPQQVASIPQCLSITPFRSVAEAAGWLYVVERSTLLSDGIRRHVLRYVPALENAVTYLSVHEGRAGEQWTAFGRMLDRIGVTPELANEAVSAANAAFSCAKLWFRSASSVPRSRTA